MSLSVLTGSDAGSLTDLSFSSATRRGARILIWPTALIGLEPWPLRRVSGIQGYHRAEIGAVLPADLVCPSQYGRENNVAEASCCMASPPDLVSGARDDTSVGPVRRRGNSCSWLRNSRGVARNRQMASMSSRGVLRTSTRISPWLLRNTGAAEQVGADGSFSDQTRDPSVPGGECCCGRGCAVCIAGLG